MQQQDPPNDILTKRLSRRRFLETTALAAAAAGVAACSDGSDEEDTQTTPDSALAAAAATATPALFQVPPAGPNVILIVIDSLRRDHVGCYGNDWIKTPSLDALAAESIVFTRAFPESLPTIPARLSLHTGIRSWPFREWEKRKGAMSLWAGWGPIPETSVTVAETLSAKGFQTGFVTDTFHYFAPAMNFHRGFQQFLWVRGQEHDPYRSVLQVTDEEVKTVFDPEVPEGLEGLKSFQGSNVHAYLSNQEGRAGEEEYQAPRVFSEAARWLEENRGAKRFFLLVDVFDPHEPWDPPQEYIDLYDPGYSGQETIAPVYSLVNYLSTAELKHMRARYAAEVTMVDRWLGTFLERARELGMLDNTLLIVTSDHGHQLAEHGIIGKLPQSLCAELVDVPLFVRRPDGAGAGSRVDALVQHHDIPPTILAFLGVPPAAPLPGLNLIDVAEERAPRRDHVSTGLNDYSWCRDSRYTFMMRNDGSNRQLYDMTADPLQTRNLAAADPAAAEAMLGKLLADAGGPLPPV